MVVIVIIMRPSPAAVPRVPRSGWTHVMMSDYLITSHLVQGGRIVGGSSGANVWLQEWKYKSRLFSLPVAGPALTFDGGWMVWWRKEGWYISIHNHAPRSVTRHQPLHSRQGFLVELETNLSEVWICRRPLIDARAFSWLKAATISFTFKNLGLFQNYT